MVVSWWIVAFFAQYMSIYFHYGDIQENKTCMSACISGVEMSRNANWRSDYWMCCWAMCMAATHQQKFRSSALRGWSSTCMYVNPYILHLHKPWGRLKWPSAITRSEEDCPFYLKPYVWIGDLQTCKMSMVMYMTLNVVSEISHHHETTQNASFKSKVKQLKSCAYGFATRKIASRPTITSIR